MNRSIIRKIRNTEWWQLNGPGVFQLFFAPALGFARMSKYYPSMKYWGVVLAIDGDHIYQFMNEEDSINFIKTLIEGNKKNKLYIRNKIKKWRQLRDKTFDIIKEIENPDLSKINNKKLLSLYKRYSDTLTELWAIPLALDGSGIYFERELFPKLLKESGLSEEKLMDKLFILTTLEKLSFNQEEHIDILKISLDIINKRIPKNMKGLKEHPGIYNKLLNHQKRFFWVRNNYLDSYIISPNDFFKEVINVLREKSEKEIKKEIRQILDFKKIKEKKKKIAKKLKVSKELLKEIELFSLFGCWRDRRKEINLITGHYITVLIKEIAKRMGLDYKKVYNFLNEEIEDFLSRGKKPDLAKVRRRKTIVFFPFGTGDFMIANEKDSKIYLKEMFKKIKEQEKQSSEIKGFVASKGEKKVIKGKVGVVLNVKKDKFKKGSILVTSMTRPEFVPMMKQAIAIITNEGGITSHAAIVSRELGIPCVIGTKIATKVLKDGDLVEVDANKGVVRILKKSK